MALKVDSTLRKAKKLIKGGDVVGAAQQYNSILELYPKNSKAIKGLALLSQHGHLTSQVKTAPPQSEIDSLRSLYNRGAWKEALERGQILASKFKNSELIFNLLGNFNAGVGHTDAAIENYNKAILLKPDYIQPHSNLGNVLNGLGRHEEAIDCYTKAIQLKPDYGPAHSNMGNTLNAIGCYEEAIPSLLKAIELKPDFVEPYYNLGTAFNAVGRHEEAIESFGKAIQLKPDLAVARSAMGRVLMGLGRLEEGLEQEEIGYGAICFDNATGVSIKHGRTT